MWRAEPPSPSPVSAHPWTNGQKIPINGILAPRDHTRLVRPFHIVNAKNCDLALILESDGRRSAGSLRGRGKTHGVISEQAGALAEGWRKTEETDGGGKGKLAGLAEAGTAHEGNLAQAGRPLRRIAVA